MTVIEAITPPGTLGSSPADYTGGSTSNLLLPRIGSALLPAFISIPILTGATSLPAHLESIRSPHSVVALRSSVAELRGATVSREVEEALPDLARSVRALRRRSGLTWDELARIFGVTRRTLYNWSIGGQVSAAHAQALAQVIARVHEVDAGDPKLTRSRLLAPTDSGATLYTRLVQQQELGVATEEPVYRPDQLLDARHDTPDQTGPITDFEPLD
jgi:DNA-binding transcriptional regulator YiaG